MFAMTITERSGALCKSRQQSNVKRATSAISGRFAGMRHVPGGLFRMGSDKFYDDERPVREVAVDGFRMDRTPVTNRQFARFVAQTGHGTFAEIAPDPTDYPGMDIALVQPGSLVFMPPGHAINLHAVAGWWAFILGADWRHSTGPGSDLSGLEDHPAVHIGYADALAYAGWTGKSLPTEAEWEFAARGKLDCADFAWGDELYPRGLRMAKTWEGIFPHHNAAPPGLERTSPVRSYPKNAFGLYDLIGNVWEWTITASDQPAEEGSDPKCCGDSQPNMPSATIRRVAKGGSHLCAPNYCQRYRPAARWAQPVDTTTSHIGFRCIIRDDDGRASARAY